MTAEQLEELAGGANPAFMDLDLDHEVIITHLARRVLAAEKLVEAAEKVLLARPGSFADAEYRLDLDIRVAAYSEASK